MAPKQRSLEAAEGVLAVQVGRVREKRAELDAIGLKLRALRGALDDKQREKKVTSASRRPRPHDPR